MEKVPSIISVSTYQPPYELSQEVTSEFAKQLFAKSFPDIERLLKVFQNGEIEKRHFTAPLHWYEKDHSLSEKNQLYIEQSLNFGVQAIKRCLQNNDYLNDEVPYEDIDAIIFISSTGFSTPSMEARLMNELPFSETTKRIPIWGLGCAGGAAGISRAYEYCLAYKKAKVLVVCIELCSLTFQKKDHSKSNLIGTSLFADGIACALVVGDEVDAHKLSKKKTIPFIRKTGSYLMPASLDVMGWDVRDDGLYVVFSRFIPSIIESWLKPIVEKFLPEELAVEQVREFILHPGGKKIIDAYERTFHLSEQQTKYARDVLRMNGNMSSPTVLYVLDECLQEEKVRGDYGLMGALGPGFSAELLLLEWR